MLNRSIFTLFALSLVAMVPASAQRVAARIPGYPKPYSLDSMAVEREIKAPRAQAFATLVAAIESLKLPASTKDSVNGTVVQPLFTKSRSIAGQPMSQYFNCGFGHLGENANRFRLRIAYAAWVDSVGPNRSLVRFGVGAGGEDVDGASKDPVACGSTGRLEGRVLDLVQQRFK